MKARLMLAALDWNAMQDSTEEKEVKNEVVWSKRRRMWVKRKRGDRTKSGQHVRGLMERALEVHSERLNLPPIQIPRLKPRGNDVP